ncbi:MAG: DUF3105 domain-containing protein [Chloroflexi bacterium]|nr:MAG: DUF3105 domain-containing protein [Chloroflexota bacterium]
MTSQSKPKVSKKEKRRQEIARQKRKRLLTIWVPLGIVVVGLVGLGYLLFLSLRGPLPIEGIVTFLRQPRGHDNEQTYEGELPPVGGLHSDVWQNCGVYDEPIDAANAVHSLEHGAVWIAYQPDLDGADVATLQDLVGGESHMLLSPYPDLQSPVVLTAWEIQLEVDSVDDTRIPDFIDQYLQGPTTPERGASCANGVGIPIE